MQALVKKHGGSEYDLAVSYTMQHSTEQLTTTADDLSHSAGTLHVSLLTAASPLVVCCQTAGPGSIRWHEVARRMTDRSSKQCRERWTVLLAQDAKRLHWSQEEDQSQQPHTYHNTSRRTALSHSTHSLNSLPLPSVAVCVACGVSYC